MKTSIIRQRVADFLKDHPPFEALPESDLLALAGSGRVRFHQAGEFVFRRADAKGQFIWVIQQGRVELLEDGSRGEKLHDVLGEGDLLGLEGFVGDGAYRYTARTASDVILYGLAADMFGSLAPQYPFLKRFLSAHFAVSGILGFGRTSWLDAEPPPPEFLRARLLAMPIDSTVPEVALRFAQSGREIIALVKGNQEVAGVLTPADLCGVASGPIAPRVRACPRITKEPLTIRVGLREMLRTHTETLAITANSSPDSPLEAIVTASDLALFCGHDVMRLLRAIRSATVTAEILPLRKQATRLVLDALGQPHDIDDCCRISTEIGLELINTCIRLAHTQVLASGLEAPHVPCCWTVFGASAREDLLATWFPTIAVVYDDTDPKYRPGDSLFFTCLAGETTAQMYACGMADPEFRWAEGSSPSMPLSEWKQFYADTIRAPFSHDLYARRELFDLKLLCGDDSLLTTMREYITAEMEQHQLLIPLLANDTFSHWPPLTFFQGLVLELDGAQHEALDIDVAALAPIAAAARVFAIAKARVAPANTLQRLEAAALDFPEGSAILREAMDALRIALYYRSIAGGAQIDPGSLRKFDQLLLKAAFTSTQRLLEFTEATFLPAS